jgi:hypothetical protein
VCLTHTFYNAGFVIKNVGFVTCCSTIQVVPGWDQFDEAGTTQVSCHYPPFNSVKGCAVTILLEVGQDIPSRNMASAKSDFDTTCTNEDLICFLPRLP